MALTYRGTFCARTGAKLPFLLAADLNGHARLTIKWDKPDGTAGYKQVRLRHNDEFVWKLTKTGVSCRHLGKMFELFEESSAYASATFRYFTGIE